MSLGLQAKQLWKRSRPFRFVTIAAVLCTVVAVVAGKTGGSGSQSNQNNQANQNSTPNPSGGGSGTPPAQQSMVQCGPGGGTQLAAPMVQGSSVPGNVTAVSPSGSQNNGVPLSVVGRFNQFLVTVDAAKVEARRGESCALMSGAMDILEPTDLAYADCFQDGQSALRNAQTCSQSHNQSEARYDSLIQAHSAFEANPSSANLAALAAARADMLDYDENRERWRTVAKPVADAEAAAVSITQSDARIARLVAAAGRAQSGGARDLEDFAAAASLEQLDISRLTVAQQEMLEDARAARLEVQDSDRRLDTLALAVSTIASGGAAARADLISAVGALTPFDQARAEPAQAEIIARAKAEAAAFAMRDLRAEAQTFQLNAATAAEHARIADLATVVNNYGGITEPAPEDSAALALAREAAAVLSRSDRRLQMMSETIAAVRAGGPSALGDDVLRSYDAVTEFDRSRMTDDQKADYVALEEAREVTIATSERDMTKSVPVFLEVSGGPQRSETLAALRSGLLRRGYNLVDTAEASAIFFALNVGELEKGGLSVGSVRVETARISVDLAGRWTLDEEPLSSVYVEGVGRGRSAGQRAVEDAVDQLLSEIELMVDGS